MAVVLKCDGCGAVSEPNQLHGTVLLQARDGYYQKLDLCPDCFNELTDTVEDKLTALRRG